MQTVKKRIEDGNPVTKILEAIDEEGAGSLVVGARRPSDLKALGGGSVSSKSSHLSPVTRVTVR